MSLSLRSTPCGGASRTESALTVVIIVEIYGLESDHKAEHE